MEHYISYRNLLGLNGTKLQLQEWGRTYRYGCPDVMLRAQMAIQNAIMSMTDKDVKRVINLRYHAAMTQKQIAGKMGLSVSTIRRLDKAGVAFVERRYKRIASELGIVIPNDEGGYIND